MLGKLTKKFNHTHLIEELDKPKIDTKKLDKIMASGSIQINAFIDEAKKISLLHKYIKTNNTAAVQWLLENQANPYTEDDYNLPAFFYFIHSGASSKIFYLLDEHNVDFGFKNSQGRMVLQDIVINGDIPLYNRVIQKVKKPFSFDGYGKNILFDAISSGDKDTMKLVFDNEEANLDIQDKNRDSLLHFVKYGDLNLIEFLLKKHVSPSLQDLHGKNIIFYLSERIEKSDSNFKIKYMTELINYALEVKDTLSQKDKDGNNALMSFLNTLQQPLSKYDQKQFLADLITQFIDSGVDINEKNHEGNNALLISVEKNDIDTVAILIEKCADINVKNSEEITPLALAVMKGNNEYLDMVKLLLSCKANPNIKDAKGMSIVEKIIFILIYTNNKEMKEDDFRSSVPIAPSLESDIQKFNEDDYIRNIFEMLVSGNMIDYKVLDSQGLPYFYVLIITENNYLAGLLFKYGANVNQPNSKNKNVLQYYLDFMDEHQVDEAVGMKIIKTIIKFGINLDHRDEYGGTVLHYTILKKPLSMTKDIITSGGAINVVDKKGRTLLHNAIWANDLEKVKFILNTKKELINTPDKLGVIPINYAAFLGNIDLVLYLMGHNSYVNNLHEKQKSTLDFLKRFHKNIFALEDAIVEDPEAKKYVLTLISNMKKEFNIVA